MAALFGKIEAFNPQQEEWPQYVERLEQFFEANDLTGEDKAVKRRATFLSLIGPESYKLLRSLLAPVKPKEKSYAELVAKLTEHYSPTPSEVMQRFRFNSRSRRNGESVAAYVAELRRLAEYCNYGDTLDKMLRDRIVWGINDEAIQRKLLQETTLTYAKAITLAQGFETASSNLKEMHAPTTELTASSSTGVTVKTEPVHKMSVKRDKPRQSDSGVTCHRCGKPGHLATVCRHRGSVCHNCKKKGHLAKVCRSKPHAKPPSQGRSTNASRPVRQVAEDSESDADDPMQPIMTANLRSVSCSPPIKVHVEVDKISIPMEVDTGASVSVMSENVYHRLWPRRGLNTTTIRLQNYSREPITVVGSTDVHVVYQGQTTTLPLVVVKGDGPTLLGRNWLTHIRLNWNEIHYTNNPGLHELLGKYSEIFQERLGTFKGYEAKIEVDPNATPRFNKARTIPYAMREKVSEELDRLVAEGTLEPVDYAEWAAPIVAVMKSDRKSVRICGDFRTTVNPVSKLNRYPIPKTEDILATLERGKLFTKLDLSQAYLQLKLDKESKEYLVISTHKGLFRYTRLPYGISSAPGIFQKAMEQLLQGIPHVSVYIDDILITAETEAEHLKILEEVLDRLAKAELRVKKHKCKFMASSVTYLGYVIDAQGIRPLPEKVEAIKQAPTPKNVTELKSYLGLLSYYGKFLPNLSTHLAPLYTLLSKRKLWKWTSAQDKAFNESKDLLTSSSLLVHFDPKLPILLACDASAYGIGAVLAHRLPDGSEKPIGYASRTLNAAERNYSQLEKEGLSLVFGIKRFYSFLFGHPFTLITDHKPLLGLLASQKPTSPHASARIRRWSLYLSMFEYKLEFRNTSAHANADALSRLPLPVEPAVNQTPPELVLLMDHLSNSPVTAHQIREGTRKDPQLAPIVQFVQQGWPNTCPDQGQLTPFFEKRTELSIYEGCLLWGTRVVIPASCREAVLTELHEGHPGATRMKGLARMYVWWPGITKDIESTVRLCSTCQMHQSTPAVAPLHPWSWPTRPWARVHLDYAGPVEGKMILVIVDAHSKWIDAIVTPNATSATVVEELRPLFAQFGLPETVVTNNGPCFVGAEFEEFLSSNGIKHITSAPYHPSSNGLAERSVQIVKKGLKKITRGSMRTRLAQILFAYRLTPQSTTGVSPSELLLGRRPRSRLDLLKPNTAERVEENQLKQKEKHDQRSRERNFAVDDDVFARNYHNGDKWLSGKILKKTGPVSYRVRLENGKERRCHQDQVRKRSVTIQQESPCVLDTPDLVIPMPEGIVLPSNDSTSSKSNSSSTPATNESMQPTPSSVAPASPNKTVDTTSKEKVYPKRNRVPVVRFEPTWTK